MPHPDPDPADVETARLLFDGGRLRQARELRGKSKVDLAYDVDVTPTAIAQFEGGSARPSADRLRRLAEALGVPPAFFAGDRPRFEVTEAEAHFRSLRSTKQADRARARAQVALLAEFVTLLRRDIALPALDLPVVPPDSTPEAAARLARSAWGLGSGPIPHVVRLLESKGIVIARLPAATPALDAFSCWIADVPYVVLVANKQAADRSRFDAAHELAHVLMDRGAPPGNVTLERRAHAFAAEFLAPAASIGPLLPRRLDWARIAALKLQWGVSMAMLVRRMRDLGCISDPTYQRAMIYMSRQGWRTQEPVHLGDPETPEILLRAGRAVRAARNVSNDDLAAEMVLPVELFDELIAPTRTAAPRSIA